MPYYFLLTWTQNGRYCRYEFPVKGTSALVGSDGIFEFNLPKLTMTKLSTGEKLQFEVIGSSGGSNIIIPEDNSSEGWLFCRRKKKNVVYAKVKGGLLGLKIQLMGFPENIGVRIVSRMSVIHIAMTVVHLVVERDISTV